MSCFRPLRAYRDRGSTRVRIGWDPGSGDFFEVPCGKCLGCRKARAREWRTRIVHEAQLYDANWFLTLTYDSEHLPPSLSLEYRDVQLFMKRLRRKFVGDRAGPNGRHPVRFFCAGEYGSKNQRPHWHLILFNVAFRDLFELPGKPGGEVLYGSRECEELWRNGSVAVGSVTARSAAYVAGYSLKKRSGKGRLLENVVDVATGEVLVRRREFVVMSRRPGLGYWWYLKFRSDLFPADHAVVEGKPQKVPRFYTEKFRVEFPQVYEEVAYDRYLTMREFARKGELTPERRAVKEELAERSEEMFGERDL